MKNAFLPLASLLTWVFLSACSQGKTTPTPRNAAAVTDGGAAPATLAGSQLKYSDNHGRSIYTFFPGGRYRFASLSQNESYADSREGRFVYAITGKDEALLSFEDEPAIKLLFRNPRSATGTIEGDVRVYQFQVLRFDAE